MCATTSLSSVSSNVVNTSSSSEVNNQDFVVVKREDVPASTDSVTSRVYDGFWRALGFARTGSGYLANGAIKVTGKVCSGAKVLTAGAVGVGYGVACLSLYGIGRVDASQTIVESEKRMMKALKDPHFVNFYRMINQQLLTLGKNEILQNLASMYLPFKGSIEQLSQEIIKINLAIAFANLAETIQNSKDIIPNYANQTSLVNLIIIMNQRIGSRFPDIESLGQMEPAQVDLAFQGIAQEIRNFLLPHGLDDIKLPLSSVGEVRVIRDLRDLIFQKYIIFGFNKLGQFLCENYMQFVGNRAQKTAWMINLQTKLGLIDPKAVYDVIASPSTFLMEYIKSNLASDASSMDWGVSLINFLDPSTEDSHLKQLNQVEMAGWVLSSLQQTLKNENSAVKSCVDFIKKSVELVTLALVSKLSDLVDISSSSGRKEVFIQEILDKSFVKLKEFRIGKEIRLDEIQTFINDLPLPPFIINRLGPQFFEKIKQLRLQLNTLNNTWDKLQKDYERAHYKVERYAGGKEILSITKAISESIFEKTAEKNLDLLQEFQLDDQIEKLMARYLPEVKFSPELKVWFQKNFKELGKKDGHSPNTIQLLKKAVEGTILQSVVKTIEQTYQNDDQQFSAKLLGRIRESFTKSFINFGESEKNNLLEALEIEKQIKTLTDQKKKWIKKFADFKKLISQLPQKERDAILEALNKHEAVLSSNQLRIKLEKKLFKLLTKLNIVGDKRESFKKELQTSLNAINEKEYAQEIGQFKSQFPSENHVSILRRFGRGIKQLKRVQNAELHKKFNAILTHCRNVIRVLDFPEAQQKLIFKALNINKTITRAGLEKELANQNFDQHEKVLHTLDVSHLNVSEQTIWRDALKLFNKIRETQGLISKIDSQILEKEKLLANKLSPFQSLTNELLAILNLNFTKESLPLPEDFKDTVWPSILKAKKNHIPRILFNQIYPLIAVFLNQNINRKKLNDLTGNEAFSNLTSEIASQAIQNIPFLFSFQSITKEILNIHNEVSKYQVTKLNHIHTLLPEILKIRGQREISAERIKDLILLKNPNNKNANEISKQLHQNLASLTKENIYLLADKKLTEAEAVNLYFDLEDYSFNLGKKIITPPELLDIYLSELGKHTGIVLTLEEAQKTIFIETIVKQKIIDKINKVIITPAEIAVQLRKSIPGAIELEKLIEKELEQAVMGDNLGFKENKEFLQGCIESAILKILIKCVEINQNGKLIQRFHEKLTSIELEYGQKHFSSEEVFKRLKEGILVEILEINNPDFFTDIPFAFREVIYNVINKQMSDSLFPLLFPIITREKDRDHLHKRSPLLTSISKALSKDLLSSIPALIASRRALTDKIFNSLFGNAGSLDQLNMFYTKVIELFKKDSNTIAKHIKNKDILKAYEQVLEKEFSSLERKTLLEKIKESKIKQNFNAILSSPEEMISSLLTKLPGLNQKTQNELSAMLQGFIALDNPNYKTLISLLEHYLEGVLLKVFIKIEEKNPSTSDKDSLVIITEKIVTVLGDTCEKIFNCAENIKFQVQKEHANLSKNALDKKINDEIKSTLDELMNELSDKILNRILGLNSLVIFEGLASHQHLFIYNAIQKKLQEFTSSIVQHLYTSDNLDEGIKQNQEKIKQLFEEASILQVLQDIGNITSVSTFYTLGAEVGNNIKGAFTASEGTLSCLEELSKGSFKIADILLNEASGKPFQKILGQIYKDLNRNPTQPFHELPKAQQISQAGKAKGAEFLANALLKPLIEAFGSLYEKESRKDHDLNGQLITSLMKEFSKHLEIIKLSKIQAQKRGEKDFTYADFLEMAGNNLHKAVPKANPDYKRSIDLIKKALNLDWTEKREESVRQIIKNKAEKDFTATEPLRIESLIEDLEIEFEILFTQDQKNRLKEIEENGIPLKEIIREDADALKLQRDKYFYNPTSKDILKALFPNGSKDLTFIAPELRDTVWNLFKKKLFPLVTSLLVELVLDPDTIQNIFINSLEAMNENLSGPILVDETPPLSDETQKELDRASGELLKHCFDMAKLPSWLVKIFKTKNGDINPAIAQSLGATLRTQFDKEFFKRTLKISIATLSARDSKGEPKISFDIRDENIKNKERAESRKQMDVLFNKVIRKSVDVGISFFIRNQWVSLQYKWNKIITQKFGKIGISLKKALDSLFYFVFIKVVGTLISYLMYPVTLLLKKAVYNFIKLDENKNIFVDVFKKQPHDQPKGPHAMHNENLIFKLIDALRENLKK